MTKRPLRQEPRAVETSNAASALTHWPTALRSAVSLCLNSPSAMFVCSASDLVIANDACRRLCGGPPSIAAGQPGNKAWPEQWDALAPLLRSVFDSAEPARFDTLQLLIECDGTRDDRYFSLSCTPILDDIGVVVGVFAQLTETVDSVREANPTPFDLIGDAEELRIITDSVPAFIAYIDRDQRYRFLNKAYEERYGAIDMLGRSVAEMTKERYPLICDYIDRALAGEKVAYENWIAYHDTSEHYVRVTLVPHRTPDGAVQGAFVLGSDITPQKLADEERERALLAERTARAEAEMLHDLGMALNSELDIQALLQRVIDVATKAVGADFGVFFYNALDAEGQPYELCALAGVAREAFAKFPMPDRSAVFGPGFDGRGVVRSDDITQDSRYGENAPHHGMPAGQLPPICSYLAVPVKSRAGEVRGGLFFGHGQHARFQKHHGHLIEGMAAQAAVAIDNARLFETVRTQAAHWQMSYEHVAVGIAEADLTGRFIELNDKFCAILGYRRDELLRLSFQDITHPDDAKIDDSLYRDLEAGKLGSYTLEKRYLRKDGRVIWVKLSASLVRDAHGNPQRGLAVVEDINERRRAEIVIMGQKKALEQIARGEPLPAILESLVETFDRQSILGGNGAILLSDAEAGFLRPVTTGGVTKEWIEAVRQLQLQPQTDDVDASRTPPVMVERVATAPRWEPARAVAAGAGVSTVWSIAICSPSQDVLGMFVVYYKEPCDPSQDELRFIAIISDTAAVAIERYRAEKSLRLQAQVLSHIHDAVIMIDRTGNIMRWNEGAERLFGYSAAEAIGQNVSLCYFPDDRQAIEQTITASLASNGRHEMVARLQRRSGEMLHGHVSLSLLHNERGKPSVVVAYVLDMTARVQAEDEISARVRQQEATARIGQLALSGVDLDDLMNQSAHIVAATLGVELCKVLELQLGGERLLLRAGVGWRDDVVASATVAATNETQAGHALLTGTPVVVDDFAAQTQFQQSPLLQQHDVVSGICVVIQGEANRAYGVLAAHSKRAHAFSPHSINFLQSIADVLATAIQRKRVEAMLQQARDDLERRVEERTAELARANQSLRDEIVDRMGVEGALRDSEAQYRMLFERNPLPAWVFDIHTRQVLAANETAVWQYGYTREEFLRMTIDMLHPSDEMVRVLDYAEQFPPETAYIGVWKHRKQDENIIDVEMFVYEVLFQGRWARLVLANDITERRRAEQEFRLLETITRAISEASDLDSALAAVLRHICETTGWVLGEAWLPGADAELMVSSGAWYTGMDGLEGFRPLAGEVHHVAEHGFVGRAWAARQPIWLSDITTDNGFARAERAHEAGLRAGTVFPVLAENEIVALLAFFLLEPRREDERLVKLVSTLAAQLGVAIQRKRAEEQLRRSELQLSEAQHLAHLGSWEWDVNDDNIKWSDELYRIFAIETGTPMSYETYLARVHPDDRTRVSHAVMAARRTHHPFTQEERIVRADGEIRHLLSQGTVVTNHKKEVTRLVGVCLDITDRKRAEERLRDYTHRLQNLSLRLLEAQETERRRIARELHDQIGQDLSVIKINLQALKRLPSDALMPQVDETIRVVEGVLATARNLSLELRPSMLDDLGLVAALRWYLDRQAQRAGFAVHFAPDNIDRRLQPTIETACFRLAQEAITNILRHAGASHVKVNLSLSDEQLQMYIVDDGNGFDVEAARVRAASGESFGLLGMEERALLAGGALEIISTTGQGTTLIARFPLNSAAPPT